MPDKIASHWGLAGQVNGYLPKIWGVFLLPVLSLVIYLIFWFIPKLDPLKTNLDRFRRYYDNFGVLLVLFMTYLHVLVLTWNYGTKFDMVKFMIPAFSAFIYYCGIVIQNSQRNWFIGIRTPWTMSNDVVWDKTHALGGKLFKLSAIISLFGFFANRYAFFLLLVPLTATVIFTFFYSYFLYQKIKKV